MCIQIEDCNLSGLAGYSYSMLSHLATRLLSLKIPHGDGSPTANIAFEVPRCSLRMQPPCAAKCQAFRWNASQFEQWNAVERHQSMIMNPLY